MLSVIAHHFHRGNGAWRPKEWREYRARREAQGRPARTFLEEHLPLLACPCLESSSSFCTAFESEIDDVNREHGKALVLSSWQEFDSFLQGLRQGNAKRFSEAASAKLCQSVRSASGALPCTKLMEHALATKGVSTHQPISGEESEGLTRTRNVQGCGGTSLVLLQAVLKDARMLAEALDWYRYWPRLAWQKWTSNCRHAGLTMRSLSRKQGWG